MLLWLIRRLTETRLFTLKAKPQWHCLWQGEWASAPPVPGVSLWGSWYMMVIRMMTRSVKLTGSEGQTRLQPAPYRDRFWQELYWKQQKYNAIINIVLRQMSFWNCDLNDLKSCQTLTQIPPHSMYVIKTLPNKGNIFFFFGLNYEGFFWCKLWLFATMYDYWYFIVNYLGFHSIG